MALTKIEADKMKSKLYFVYLPEFLRLSENYSNKNYYKVLKIVNDLDIPVIDLKNLLDKEKNPLIFIRLVWMPILMWKDIENLLR